MTVPGETLPALSETVERTAGTPPGEDRGAYRLGVISAVDFTSRPPTLTIGEGEFARPMRFQGSVTQYNTGQMVVWLEQPGAPMVLGPVPIVGADPADPESLEPFQTASLVSSWVHWGAPHAVPSFYKQNDGWVRLKGVLKNGSSATATMFTLPVGYRPPFTVYATVFSANVTGYIRITTAGVVSMPAGGGTGSVSLDGITFPTAWNRAAWRVVRFQNGWESNGILADATPEIFVRDDGWCWMKGSAFDGTANAVLGELSQECFGRENGFTLAAYTSAAASNVPAQIDIHYSGEIVFRESISSPLILGNMYWFGSNSIGVSGFTDAALLNGWVHHSTGPIQPPLPGYYKDHFGVVHLQGVANGAGKSANTIFNLPAGYRPLETQIFVAKPDDFSTGRVDVDAGGDVIYVAGSGGTTGQFSLQQVSFRAEQ